ncbi:hypothetical protein H1230_06905 [Paenibacillus sp. 19GGS1-52]|uniref:hypothetical protein n=1 Tax=Paenibacillus sp. 19GGS1-52 TaxID=2758563 RepID=UPI001EFB56E9|nr:hypothetical protein [Paenibacillus sp. 19GGS1-52]ULO08530.1 hypothetical protein H1230_06905 [Paenibacillus sp. 19GGS1-52]
MELDTFYQSITEQERNTFSELAHAAMLFGYKPKKAKTQAVNYVFANNRTKHHINVLMN